MKRQVCIVSLFVLLAFSALIAQQDGPQQDGPKADNPLPEAQVLGPQLIAWSEMQEPKPLQQSPSQAPTPEPRPETAPPQQPTPSQPEQKPTQPPSASQSPDQDQHAQPAAQTFTGTINKEGGTYVLKVSDTSSYKLDDQDQAKQYEGQRVRVFGTLESSGDLIRVQKIEPIS
jgi:outer membrane biosynthesis protein TonB